jgi:hypothetical protein
LEDATPSALRPKPQQHLSCVRQASIEASQLLSHLQIEVEQQVEVENENINFKIQLKRKLKFKLKYKSTNIAAVLDVSTQ